jgi:hypothetical protein
LSRPRHLVARLLWIFPVLLILLMIHQLKVAFDIRETLEHGTPATARIVDSFKTDRVDISFEYVSLRVELEDGQVIERAKMALPHGLYPQIEGRETVSVRVRPGAAQEIVIEEIARPQWRLAAINAGMSLIGFLIVVTGVFSWNRYLGRNGDPAVRPAESVSPPVRQGTSA